MATDQVSAAASLEMPAAVHGAAAEQSAPSWGLLEAFAYFDNVKNSTTAISTTPDNKHIQITFCPRAPPLLSRFCIHTPDGADMYREPLIVATEADLALLRVDSGFSGSRLDYYIYQAVNESGKKPSLTLLPRTPYYLYFHPKDIGLIRLPGKEYIVVGFRYLPDAFPYGGLTLCVYDSKRADWRLHARLSLSVQGRQEHGNKILVHKNCKVLTVGGDAGTMAFVDLWRGVLFCDVLTLEREAARQAKHKAILPLLGYVKLPDDLRRTAKVNGDARLFRDIAFLNNHLKCVDLASRSLWIRPATTTSGAWSQQYMIRSFKAIANRNSGVNLLPGLKTVYRAFTGLHVRQPVVDLQDDDDGRILYFTVKTNQLAGQGSVLALDLLTKKILGVAPFVIRYEMTYDFTYMHTRLFKHFSGAKASLNQSGMVLQRSASKLKDEAQEKLDGGFVVEDGDAMALD